MDRRIMGIETEYGVTCALASGKALTPDEVARYLFADVVAQNRSSNVFLPNGGRLYLDVGNHPEYATAECDSLPDLLAQERAGTAVMQDLVDQAQRRMSEDGVSGQVFLLKNNVDSVGNAFGCHENYLVSRATDLTVLTNVLVPFLVTRQIICGAGRIVPRRDGSAFFAVSQRAELTWEGASSATTRSRPMINTRDEPHAEAARFRRLHVIVGDSSMAESSTMVKVAAMDLVLRALEAGASVPSLMPAQISGAIRAVSTDLSGRGMYRTVEGRSVTALEVQRIYHAMVADHLAACGPARPWDHEAVTLWGDIVSALEQDEPLRVAAHVDWIAKWALLSRQAERYDLTWEDARLRQLDVLYHDINPARGLAAKLEASGVLQRWTSAEQVTDAVRRPPQTTRAALRGAFLSAAHHFRREVTADWTHLRWEGGSERSVVCQDPFASSDSRVDELIQLMERVR
ncbi:Pup--protein ligase [Austwickia sp. TVS 96-490-7B]|uniref:Pup--protein ligase n=1 Tax=Austwickia sp. TVS 96-490-7B TaxID=2830843 RepID=UPI001C579E64|nr:Pup--protein ligase [Austwickia sp. TVS 96-490-7B]MBW3085400.1 Pup--protein ligase [Austwickia sp. TVS 96-490-7B]